MFLKLGYVLQGHQPYGRDKADSPIYLIVSIYQKLEIGDQLIGKNPEDTGGALLRNNVVPVLLGTQKMVTCAKA